MFLTLTKNVVDQAKTNIFDEFNQKCCNIKKIFREVN